ncbi:MAG: type 1 glutamine amidotransferase [Halothiobacillus sp.]
MNVLAFQHESFEGLGAMAPWFEAQGATVRMIRQFEPESTPLPDPATLDLIIVLGGPMGVHDTAQYPWLAAEKAYIRASFEAKIPMLGICLGAQLIAEQLGAVVGKNPQPEIGWWPMEWTSAARTIWPEAVPASTVFHWHGDTFSLPAGSELLASSKACAHQGFLFEDRVVGLQFHLEMTAATVNDLIAHGSDDLIEAPFIANAQTMRAEPLKSFQTNQALMAQLLGYLTQRMGSK